MFAAATAFRDAPLPNPPNNIDEHVGQSLTRLRIAASLSVADMALAVDVTPDHLILIEAGRRRASAELLIEVARRLGVSTSVFYEGL